jgi:hypothetical protein
MTANGAASDAEALVSRARRYQIGAVLRYRVRGQTAWHEGVMENISYSGVLIRTGQFLPPNTCIEMRFFLPVELNGEHAAEVLCRGSIVRSSPGAITPGSVHLAARITHSRFLRRTSKQEEIARDSLFTAGPLFD